MIVSTILGSRCSCFCVGHGCDVGCRLAITKPIGYNQAVWLFDYFDNLSARTVELQSTPGRAVLRGCRLAK